MKEYIFEAEKVDWLDAYHVNEVKCELIRCKDCKWFGKIGCAVNIVDESDEPEENDYCSWAERKDNGADKRRR